MIDPLCPICVPVRPDAQVFYRCPQHRECVEHRWGEWLLVAPGEFVRQCLNDCQETQERGTDTP